MVVGVVLEGWDVYLRGETFLECCEGRHIERVVTTLSRNYKQKKNWTVLREVRRCVSSV
jgi:hypothetical protein